MTEELCPNCEAPFSDLQMMGVGGNQASPRFQCGSIFVPVANRLVVKTYACMKIAELRASIAKPAADVDAIAKAIVDIPSRVESLGGQRFEYVKLSEVIDTIYSVGGKQPAAVPEAVAKDAAAILVQALEEIVWQRPLGVRPSKHGEAMERAASIALHKYNALLSAADTEVKNG